MKPAFSGTQIYKQTDVRFIYTLLYQVNTVPLGVLWLYPIFYFCDREKPISISSNACTVHNITSINLTRLGTKSINHSIDHSERIHVILIKFIFFFILILTLNKHQNTSSLDQIVVYRYKLRRTIPWPFHGPITNTRVSQFKTIHFSVYVPYSVIAFTFE